MNEQLLQAIAANLTMTELQELVMRFAINRAVEVLIEAGKPVNARNILIYLNVPNVVNQLDQCSRDMIEERDRTIPKYLRSGWKKQAFTSGDRIVRLSDDAYRAIGDSLVEFNDMEREAFDPPSSLDRDQKRMYRERIKARSAALDELGF